MPQYGERRLQITVQALGDALRPVHGGSHYQNPTTLQAAEDMAASLLKDEGKPQSWFGCSHLVNAVSIAWQTLEWDGIRWNQVTLAGTEWGWKVVER